MIVGVGVVGDGVLIGVGRNVGTGVGEQLVHSSVILVSTPPATRPFLYTHHISEPTGGVFSYSPVVSSTLAWTLAALITQYSSKSASFDQWISARLS